MSDKTILKTVYVLLILINLKYIFFVVQIPYTYLFTDFRKENSSVSLINAIEKNSKDLKKEHIVGFISDVEQDNVFYAPSAIKNFYTAQYAIVPAILKTTVKEKYTIGMFEHTTMIPSFLKLKKKVNGNIFIFERGKK